LKKAWQLILVFQLTKLLSSSNTLNPKLAIDLDFRPTSKNLPKVRKYV
jgi:hypothetical protein